MSDSFYVTSSQDVSIFLQVTQAYTSLWSTNSIVHKYHLFFIHSIVDGHVDCSEDLAIMNFATIKLLVHIDFKLGWNKNVNFLFHVNFKLGKSQNMKSLMSDMLATTIFISETSC